MAIVCVSDSLVPNKLLESAPPQRKKSIQDPVQGLGVSGFGVGAWVLPSYSNSL